MKNQKDRKKIFLNFRKNLTILFSGNAISSLFGFFALAVNARALGPDQFGVLALLQSYVAIITALLCFDTWQPVIKFGSAAVVAKDSKRLHEIVKFGILCDFAAAWAATFIGLATIWIASALGAFSNEYLAFAIIYCLTIPFTAYSSAKGLLRLYGRFDYLTSVQVGVSAITLLISILLWYYRAKFSAYIYAFSFINIIQFLIISALALNAWSVNNQKSFFLSGRIFTFSDASLSKEFLKFSWSTNALSTINVLRQHIDIFLVAYLLGPSATGLYKVANQAASLISRFGDPLQQVIFPEIATLAAEKNFEKLKKIIIISFFFGAILLGIFLAASCLFGDIVMSALGGGIYSSATSAFLWLVFSHSLSVAGFHLRPCVVSFISPIVYLKNSIIAMIVFIPSLYICVANFQVVGAGIAQSIFTLIWFSLNSVVIFQHISFDLSDFDGFKNSLLRVIGKIK